MGTPVSHDAASTDLERQTIRKITWRLIPFLFLLYVFIYVDRANIGYAALHMNQELGLTGEAFGFAAGLFFIGYFVCEVPSNAALKKFGARPWIARILVTWGLLAMAMGLVQNAWQLCLVRFLLGVAEAGFFPGITVYLGRWFRGRELASATSLFVASIPASYIIAAPLSTWIMESVSWAGLSGWRWMFVLEGVPALVLGLLCLVVLTESPARARRLTPEQRQWIVGQLEAEGEAQNQATQDLSIWRTLVSPKVLYLSIIYFAYQVGSLGVGYWLPQIIKGLGHGLTSIQIGLTGAAPYCLATIGMIWWSRRSDRKHERKFHSWLPMGVAAVAMFFAAALHQPVLVMASIAVALTGLYAFKSPFWVLPSHFLSVTSAGTAVAVVNSIGNLGGFVGPSVQGMIVGATGSGRAGLYGFAGLLLVATIMMAAMRLRPRTNTDDTRTRGLDIIATDPRQTARPGHARQHIAGEILQEAD